MTREEARLEIRISYVYQRGVEKNASPSSLIKHVSPAGFGNMSCHVVLIQLHQSTESFGELSLRFFPRV